MKATRNMSHQPCSLPQKSCGVTLIELMIAMVIGLLMIAGALTLYARTRDSYQTLDSISRLQESARYAMDVLEDDVRLAGFWGLTNNPANVTNIGATIAVGSTCGNWPNNWATDLGNFIAGSNDSYGLTCAAYGSGAQANTDVIAVRRASAQRITQTAAGVTPFDNDILVATSRSTGVLFVGADALAAGYDIADVANQPHTDDTRQLFVNAYYVSKDSSLGTGYPSLRRWTLGAGPTMTDQEIMPGVEDMQIQYGIDSTAFATGDQRVAAYYVDPGAVPAGAEVVAVRIWLRVRSQSLDLGFVDNTPYVYADENTAAIGDHYHRFVLQRTIQIRNTRQ
jgi:type IV pilus assembly protein PilW